MFDRPTTEQSVSMRDHRPHNIAISMLMTKLSNSPYFFRALILIGLALVLTTPAMSLAESQAEDSGEQTSAPSNANASALLNDVNPSIMLKGSVWRTKPGIVFLKTPIGLLTLSSKTTLKDFRASQEASFWIHGPYLVVDILQRHDGSRAHRYLSGPMAKQDGEAKELTRWTPEGEKIFQAGAYEQTLALIRDGEPVTVEVDDSDTIIGVHNLQFDLQIGQIPTNGSDAHLLLTGTVSRLKSNFIFFRTPVGVINVNTKIGIKDAKVGQTMTLRMHRQHAVVELSAPNATVPARRFVTGPLEFATSDHKSVKLWTPQGEQTYPTDRGKAALAGMKEGSPITVELNGQGNVVEFHHPN
jgi:hypothetical protein